MSDRTSSPAPQAHGDSELERKLVDRIARFVRTRDRSRADLRDRLIGEFGDANAVSAALRRAEELGYVDDGRMALERAKSLRRRGASSARIRADLERRGVEEALASQVLSDLAAEGWDERAAAARVVERRLGRARAASDNERRRTLQALSRAGFDYDVAADAVSAASSIDESE